MLGRFRLPAFRGPRSATLAFAALGCPPRRITTFLLGIIVILRVMNREALRQIRLYRGGRQHGRLRVGESVVV